ncbi:MAG: HEAT repeat domain-containing protein [Planctomycetes bacterium]|nr:HEAT repeat domain-containing protein [Planctomycetota bacterium]
MRLRLAAVPLAVASLLSTATAIAQGDEGGAPAENSGPEGFRKRPRGELVVSKVWEEWNPPAELEAAVTALAGADRGKAAAAQEMLEEAGHEGLLVLVDALRHDRPSLERQDGARRLLASGKERSVPGLIEGLFHPEFSVRAASARILGEIGPEAAAAGSYLLETLQDRNSWVREHAVLALARVRGPDQETVEAIARSRRDWDSHVRERAAETIASMGRPAGAATSALVSSLSFEPEVGVRAACARALGRIAAPATGAVEPLLDAALDETRPVSAAAREALVFAAADRALALEVAGYLEDPGRSGVALSTLQQATGQPFLTKVEWESFLGTEAPSAPDEPDGEESPDPGEPGGEESPGPDGAGESKEPADESDEAGSEDGK